MKKIFCILMAMFFVATCFAEVKVYESTELGGWIILEPTDNLSLSKDSYIITISDKVDVEYAKNFLGKQAFQLLITCGHIQTITYNKLDGYRYIDWTYRYTDKSFYSRELVLDFILNSIRRK